jgi:hypothetical protein
VTEKTGSDRRWAVREMRCSEREEGQRERKGAIKEKSGSERVEAQ